MQSMEAIHGKHEITADVKEKHESVNINATKNKAGAGGAKEQWEAKAEKQSQLKERAR